MSMRKPLVFILLTLLTATSAFAAKFSGDAFSLGVGGRGLALGGAVVAGPFDGTAAYWNPAGMNYLRGRYLTAMHAETFGSLLNQDFVAYVDANRKEEAVISAFSFYIYYLGGGGIKITQLNQFNRPFVVREESHGDWLFSAAVSGKVAGKIDLGATAKVIYRDIGTESGFGLTMDAGALYTANQYLRLGLMVTDITSGFIRYSGGTQLTDSTGATFESTNHTEAIIPTVKPGLMLTYRYDDWTGRLVASGDIKFENLRTAAQYWTGSLSLDTHYGLEIGWREMLFGRTGFDIGRFTAGAGVDIRRFTIDFAYLHHDDLDETYRVSAGYRF
ncbi:MAG: hypothetical protein D6800_01985 [Candidatus Zixiibacteriota bacterium]|nr:MAG: hypothetical protein D6800_01985 [candidate division Zixibacteria bacterium]